MQTCGHRGERSRNKKRGRGKDLCISKRHVYTKNKAGRLVENRLTYQVYQNTCSYHHGLCFGLGRTVKVIRTLMETECLVIILASFIQMKLIILIIKIKEIMKSSDKKGHSQLWDRTDQDTTFASSKSVYLNPKSNVPFGCIKKSASILSSVSFDPRSFTENFFLANFNSSYDIILS